jgi:formate dehydrogenase major subunit
VPGLGASFGRGAATGYQQDLANADCILIMGSNMAEAHPVGFRWPMKARERGATIIHVDPRFSRTSACANMHVGIRAGSDIAFLGGIINYILTHEKWFKEYVLAYTNASTIIDERFKDAEDLEGIFSGYDHNKRAYEGGKGHWDYKDSPSSRKNQGPEGDSQPEKQGKGGEGSQGAGQRESQGGEHGIHGYSVMGGGASAHKSEKSAATQANPPKDPTLQNPHCVMNLLRKHYARYTPQFVSQVCGCSEKELIRVAELLCANSGRERTGAIVYAVGWTQHMTGVQMIRAAGILQLLLGNMGRPGGNIMAMRGHACIQGSTDIPTLYDLLPGYLPQPVCDEHHQTIDSYCEYEGMPTGYWVNMKKFTVSLLKAWYGDAATKENDYHFDWIPRLDGDYSQLPYFQSMAEGDVKGYFLLGQNPAGGGPNAGLHRAGLRQLDWLVVADWFEHESAVFWKDDPKGPAAREIKTEVFFIPAASIAAKEGSFTNTQRLLQWHDKAVDPDGESRSDLWFFYNLGKKIKELYKDSTRPQDAPIKAMTWDYEYDQPPRLPDGSLSKIEGEPDAQKVLQEINGYYLNQTDPSNGKPKLLKTFNECKDDGTTAVGGWIYTGVYPSYDRNRSADRTTGNNPVQPEWGFAWPANRRIMYNRCSADPAGKPWSERKKYVWWDEQQQKWVGFDVPDFEPSKPPSYRPAANAKGMDAIAGDQPFIMKPDGVAWLFSPAVKDGPFPTHYEAVESPVSNMLYPKQNDSPTARYFEGPLNIIDHVPSKDFPIIGCTFRLTEHYLSGPMSRFNSWLNELQPEMFVELSPELADEKGIAHGSLCTIRSARGTIEARAMVTTRMKPLQVQGKTIHQVGLPFHWSFAGEAVGCQANDLTSLLAEPNVSIHEGKVFTCDIQPGGSPSVRPHATKPLSRWPTKEKSPDTTRSAQPEGQLHKGGSQ